MVFQKSKAEKKTICSSFSSGQNNMGWSIQQLEANRVCRQMSIKENLNRIYRLLSSGQLQQTSSDEINRLRSENERLLDFQEEDQEENKTNKKSN